ncbi:hypothetical protein TL16_g05487 [Triparma laevis f. inornata]|uniref:Uncharacterized protein n=1 Tax=Triparma laevis f. inornata TaxID=1714386 RepID=A0A9W7AF40_9STRA|nr:hypothetical protein TL16_g05487 [Triparma laevis f. inornata]
MEDSTTIDTTDLGMAFTDLGMAFTDLSRSQLDAILATSDLDERIRLTAETCGIKHYNDNPRSAILVDFCYYSLMFCEENEFEKEQTSAFFSIMLKVFKASVDDGMDKDSAFSLFKSLVLSHSVSDPSTSAVELFTLPCVKKMTSYVSNTFFRYVDSFVYVFKTEQKVVTVVKPLEVETPLESPPLMCASPIITLKL